MSATQAAGMIFGMWTGERSLHLETKREKLIDIKALENNANVKRWLDGYIDDLEADIADAKIEEEREF